MSYKLLFAITIILALLQTSTLFGQKTYKGKTISFDDKRPLPNVNIKLKNLGIKTISDDKGNFEINSVNDNIDTLIFSSIGFITHKVATNVFKPLQFIALKEDEQNLRTVSVSVGGKATERLSKYQQNQINNELIKEKNESILRHEEKSYTIVSSFFPMAKLFTSPVDSFKIEHVFVARHQSIASELIMNKTRVGSVNPFPLSFMRYSEVIRPTTARFYISIASVDTTTGLPGSLLYNHKILVDLANYRFDNEIDLSSLNIRPKQRSFFIVIEWLFIPYNQTFGISHKLNPASEKEAQFPMYISSFEPLIPTYSKYSDLVAKRYQFVDGKWIKHNWPPDKMGRSKELALATDISYYQNPKK